MVINSKQVTSSVNSGGKYAALVHTHSISDVNGLQDILDSLETGDVTVTIESVEGLQSALDSKQAKGNYLVPADLNGYAQEADLDGKADTDHGHEVSDVNGLQGLLDGKQPSGSYATAAQGAKADTAVQPGDLGTAASTDATAYATAAQGAKADTAVQPNDLPWTPTETAWNELVQRVEALEAGVPE